LDHYNEGNYDEGIKNVDKIIEKKLHMFREEVMNTPHLTANQKMAQFNSLVNGSASIKKLSEKREDLIMQKRLSNLMS